jgi:hypothetical protein
MNGRCTIIHVGYCSGNGQIKIFKDALIYRSDKPPAMPIKMPLKIPPPNYGPLFVGV